MATQPSRRTVQGGCWPPYALATVSERSRGMCGERRDHRQSSTHRLVLLGCGGGRRPLRSSACPPYSAVQSAVTRVRLRPRALTAAPCCYPVEALRVCAHTETHRRATARGITLSSPGLSPPCGQGQAARGRGDVAAGPRSPFSRQLPPPPPLPWPMSRLVNTKAGGYGGGVG